MAGAKPEKPPLDPVRQNAIHAERIRKEMKCQKLHTEYFINPYKKIDILPENPMSRTVQEPGKVDAEFMEAYHRARLEPNKKYTHPQTESQVTGWLSTPLIVSDRTDRRFNFYRQHTDITK